jgi:hypothetical protein
MKKLTCIFLFLFLIGLLLMVVPTIAQDATEAPVPTEEATLVATLEPTAVVTPIPAEPDPIIVDQTGFRVSLLGLLAAVGMIFLGGAGLGVAWATVRANKQIKDYTEKLYEATSPDTQDKIDKGYQFAKDAWNRVDELAREVLKFVGEVTDKAPNDAGS